MNWKIIVELTTKKGERQLRNTSFLDHLSNSNDVWLGTFFLVFTQKARQSPANMQRKKKKLEAKHNDTKLLDDVLNYQRSIPVMWYLNWVSRPKQRRLNTTRLSDLIVWKSARRNKKFTYATFFFLLFSAWFLFLSSVSTRGSRQNISAAVLCCCCYEMV